ncbi:OmpA family protein [Vibrio albus]|nr:OmpA family protein [Vibrio albus]
MKKYAGVLIVALVGMITLSGCQSLMRNSMLDTAPKNEFQVRNPEWGEPQEAPVVNREIVAPTSYVEGPYGEKRSDTEDELVYFLNQLGIAHQVVPGNHLMVKIKKKIQFDTGSAYVSANSRKWLNQIGQFLARHESVNIVIDGHTDSTGKKTLNDKLSQNRAAQVKEQFLKQHVPSGSVYTRGYGEYMPECSNRSESGKACNRRAELTLIIDRY